MLINYNTDKVYNQFYAEVKGCLQGFEKESIRDAYHHAYIILINMSEDEQKKIKNVSAWLVTVMKHHLIDEKRAGDTRKKREEKSLRVWLQKYKDPTNKLDNLDKAVIRNVLTGLLSILPPRQRQVIEAIMEDNTDAEIATLLEIEESTVRSHKKKAIKTIKDKLTGL